MKKIVSSLLILVFSVSFAQVSWQGGTTPESNQSATILFDKTGTGLAAYTGTIYAHTGVTLNGTAWSNVIGSWNNNVTQPALTFVGGSTYSLTLSPTIMQKYAVTSGSITK